MTYTNTELAACTRRVARLRLLALVLAAASLIAAACDPPVDASDPYVGEVYLDTDLTEHLDVVYGSGPDANGNTVDMAMDIYVPPSTGSDRPTAVFIHGGGFSGGDKSSLRFAAKGMARRGWTSITLGYRLNTSSNVVARAAGGIGDGQIAVSWLRDNAAVYDIDVNRIALIGSSAGGVIALGTSVDVDLAGARNPSSSSAVPTAVISTGAHVTAGFDSGIYSTADAVGPALMHFHELDNAMTYNGGSSSDEVFFDTCVRFHDNGGRCSAWIELGTGHTTPISPTGDYMTTRGFAFLTTELDLANAPAPS